jgi:TfoX/Sxy family transcriptional regulator of competence genes
MAYDQDLAARIRAAIGARPSITEKQMFGGIAFMLDGKMFVGVVKDDLMARVGPERFDDWLKKPGARQMDHTGRPMTGYAFVSPDGLATDEELRQWVEQCAAYVATVPAAKKKRKP